MIDLCPAPMIYYPAPVERHAVTKIAAEMGIDVVPELYFDLPYEDDGTLALKRSNEGADLDETRQKLCLFLDTGNTLSINGTRVPISARSICLHGDGPNAVDLATTIGATLTERGYALQPLEPAPTIQHQAAQ